MVDWSPLRRLLTDVESLVTFSWAELDTLVGGLPRSAYIHNAYWKGSRTGWPDFTTTDVQVGEAVTFVRLGSQLRVEPRRHTTAGTTGHVDGEANVILIGCVKQKLSTPAAARDLYISPLFRKGRSYAERAGVAWYVISAEHGLVDPDEVLAPYDLWMAKTSLEYRRAWGQKVVVDLESALGVLTGKTVEIHASAMYVNAIRTPLQNRGAVVFEPLAGLGLGTRLSWYNQLLMPSPSSSPDVSQLVAQLTNSGASISPTDFLATMGSGFQLPGLYSWWIDGVGATDLSKGLGHRVEAGLIYAGLAGATRSKSGQKSKNTLWGRINGMHLGGRHEFSTFRLSLGSVLAEAGGESEINEESLTNWMHEHLRVIAIPVDDADTLGQIETLVLAHIDPPFNLAKMARTELRRSLSDLRRKYGRKGRRIPAKGGDDQTS